MSKIIATDHLETQNWEVTFDNLAPTYADLLIGFTDKSPVIEFKNLRFKYELRQNFDVKQSGVFPPSGIKYVNTDQSYIVAERLNMEMETEYELYLWAENNGQSFEKTVSFTTPRPAQPFSSWTWDGEKWNPPVPYPDDGNDYTWDEETTSWVVAETDETES